MGTDGEPLGAPARGQPPLGRFVDGGVERQFGHWRAERSLPLVRVGMVTAFAGGLILVVAGLLSEGGARELIPAVLLVSPGFALAFGTTYLPSTRWVQPAATAANVWWGANVVWACHHAMAAPELATTAVLLVSLFGLIVFRLTPAPGTIAAATVAGLHQWLIVASDAELQGGDTLHSVITWMVLVAAVVVVMVIDREERTQFSQEWTIAAQAEVISRERERADLLLHNVLPAAIAERLKAGPGLIADHHDNVTVMFADVVGFTPLSARLPAAEVVLLLDEVFHTIDDIVDRHGVEKIKTVGDAYMAVAGAPEARPDHTEAIAEVALDIRDALKDMSSRMPDPIEMRLGIATGDAVGGVIGRRKFAYDLWSDTVNTAARMESHGLPGRIQVTEATAKVLAPAYHVRRRGIVDLKGKGPTETWLLEDRRESLAP